MKYFLLAGLFIISCSCTAQKQGNTWYFGMGAGLNFSNGIPVAIYDGKTGTDLSPGTNQEGTSSISDSAGHILFYTGGETIWNRNHNAMPNGSGIAGGVSSTQTSIIVPLPGSGHLFYVFTTDEFQHYSTPQIPKGYRYSVVDMCLIDGLGDVPSDQKNILLLDSSTEKIAACEDATGNGYWVLGHKMFSDEFHAWHITDTGVSNAVVSPIGVRHGWSDFFSNWHFGQAQGQMKFNAQGTKIALAIGNRDPATVEFFDFDKTTGVVSNTCHITIDSTSNGQTSGKRAYGIEFSPDGTKVYAPVNGGVGGCYLYQFDLNAGDCNAVKASGVRIYQGMQGGVSFHGLQLGPDNKIYTANPGHDLGCINSPDLSGIAADFVPVVIDLLPGLSAYTLPSFIAGFKYRNTIGCDTAAVVIPPPTPPIIIDTVDTSIDVVDSSCNIAAKTLVYPNPSAGILIIDKKVTACKVTLCLYNMAGQLVKKEIVINDGINEIKLTDLAAGIYYYKFISEGKAVLTGRIVKQ